MAERMSAYDVKMAYMDMLDECYEPVKLTGDMEYAVSHILELVDPIVFEIGLDEYIVSQVEDGVWCVDGYGEYEPECDCPAPDEVHFDDCCKEAHPIRHVVEVK